MEDFLINIINLKNGEHSFDFKLGKRFFLMFSEEIVNDARLAVNLVLKKSETMIEARFAIAGKVDLSCDRSLEIFAEPLEVKHTMFFKFGDRAEELSEDVWVVPFNQYEIDFSQFMYDLVAVALPMKRLHPKFGTEESEDDLLEDEDRSFLVYSSEVRSADDDDAPVDPRWEALKKLKKDS